MNFKSLFFFLMLVVAAHGVCELPKAVGHCRADLPRYFYSDGVCELFHYSGCGGNDNNFHTKDSCEETCLIKKDGSGNRVCELPQSVGPCRAYLKRWFYSNGSCELFHYSGCGGNDNNFDTKDNCEKTCLKDNGVEESDASVAEDNGDDIADNNECD